MKSADTGTMQHHSMFLRLAYSELPSPRHRILLSSCPACRSWSPDDRAICGALAGFALGVLAFYGIGFPLGLLLSRCHSAATTSPVDPGMLRAAGSSGLGSNGAGSGGSHHGVLSVVPLDAALPMMIASGYLSARSLPMSSSVYTSARPHSESSQIATGLMGGGPVAAIRLPATMARSYSAGPSYFT